MSRDFNLDQKLIIEFTIFKFLCNWSLNLWLFFYWPFLGGGSDAVFCMVLWWQSKSMFLTACGLIAFWSPHWRKRDFITKLSVFITEPAHEIMARFVLRKLILQSRMRSHPVWLDVWILVGPFVWAFAGRLCDKYHNLMSFFYSSSWCSAIFDCDAP